MNLLKFSAIALFAFSMVSCGLRNSSSKDTQSFWEDSVKPGTYNIVYRESSAYGENANKVSLEISIYDNREFEVREKTECGLVRIYHTSIATMSGYIHKHRENYDGCERVWYTLSGTNSENIGRCYAILPSGAFYAYGSDEWREMSRQKSEGTIY